MAVQTSVQQSATQIGGQEDLRASHSATQGVSYAQQPGSLATDLNTAEGKQDENDAPSPSQVVGVGVLIGAAAIIVGVFGVGFMRARVERRLGHLFRRVVDSTYDINVPLLLPVAIVEAVREMLTERRGVFPLSGK